MSEIPVLFVGRYKDENYRVPYINQSILRAKSYGNKILLLGEGSKEFDEQFPMEDYEKMAQRFDHAYVHMATYKENYARLTFRRHFVIREFMEKENIPMLFLCENDVCKCRRKTVTFFVAV